MGVSAFECPEFVQPADGHHGPRRRTDAKRRSAVGAVRKSADEGCYVVAGDFLGSYTAQGRNMPGVARQVAPVGGQGIDCESAFHAHVLEIVGHGTVNAVCGREGGAGAGAAVAAGAGA